MFIKRLINKLKKTAEWQYLEFHSECGDPIYGHTYAECSNCHRIRIIDNYCPNCGKKMRVPDCASA